MNNKRNNELDVIKIKAKFCVLQRMLPRKKTDSQENEVKYMEDMYIVRDLHSEDIKNSYKNKKLKMTKDLNMHLCKDDIQMDNK